MSDKLRQCLIGAHDTYAYHDYAGKELCTEQRLAPVAESSNCNVLGRRGEVNTRNRPVRP